MVQSSVGGQDGVVGLHNGSCHLRSRVDGELQFGFFAIINRETFHQKRREPGTSATSKRVEDEEPLKAATLVSKFANPVQNQVHDFFTNGVMTSSVIIGRILFARNQLLGMKQLAISSVRTSSITDGSKSTKTALGTCLPAPVSVKKVLKESSPTVLSEGIVPSG